ncbi:MAG: 16S rRNA (guanine(527)-N(7))-methyltransferase RsmG [Coriobacteriia bacterium]|nr:16S rRNA (guanine(527)-N(7))-methyltransferase RsmG [Coriobacteriia bacterium]
MLDSYLQEGGICLSDEVIQLLNRHLDYVLEVNKSIRLTAIHDRSEGERLHIVDSLMVLPEVLDAPEGKMLDIGTGGGYPGFPLALAANRSVDLLDSVQKKAKAIDSFLQESYTSELSIKTIGLRAEELALEQPESYTVVLARAVSSLPALVELSSPLLETGGRLIAHKGPLDNEELARANSAASIVGMEFSSEREYVLPGGDERRTVYVFEKLSQPEIDLPRRSGRAQRKPLA